MGIDLSGKVALVTGAASGIGRATARRMALAGARLLIVDRDPKECEAACDEVRGAGGDARWRAADVSQAHQVAAMVDFALSSFGRLDCAVNNAGIQGDLASTVECSEENWDRIIGINLKGVWLCLKNEIPAMLKTGGGAIVNIASNFGLVGSQGMPAYSASKHGVVGLTKTASIEFARAGIRVNAVCPGPTMTPLVDEVVRQDPRILDAINSRLPIGRMGTADEVAQAVAWLCSDESVFVVGAVLSVDGGYVAQ